MFDRPASFQARRNRGGADACFISPRRERQGSSLKRQESSGSRVAVLFLDQHPAAISWRIGAVVVRAIKAVCRRWSWSHAGKEALECFPFGADRNASATVSGVSTMVRVETALPHGRPRLVLGRAGSSMLKIASAAFQRFAHVAATRCRMALSQIARSYLHVLAAVAPAPPSRVSVLGAIGGQLYGDESTKSLSGEIDKRGHSGELYLSLGLFTCPDIAVTPWR
jgi:hypothetical protein